MTASATSLACTPAGSAPVHRDTHVAALALRQALRGEHVFHLGRADALGQRGERAVRGGVRIAAHDGHPRQGRPLLRSDDVHDALAHVVDAELADAEVPAVGVEGLHLDPRDLVDDAGDPRPTLGRDRGHVVIRRREVRVHAPGTPARQPQSLERLRRGDLVQQVPVDVEQAHAVGPVGDVVGVPDLVVEGPAAHGVSRAQKSGSGRDSTGACRGSERRTPIPKMRNTL